MKDIKINFLSLSARPDGGGGLTLDSVVLETIQAEKEGPESSSSSYIFQVSKCPHLKMTEEEAGAKIVQPLGVNNYSAYTCCKIGGSTKDEPPKELVAFAIDKVKKMEEDLGLQEQEKSKNT